MLYVTKPVNVTRIGISKKNHTHTHTHTSHTHTTHTHTHTHTNTHTHTHKHTNTGSVVASDKNICLEILAHTSSVLSPRRVT